MRVVQRHRQRHLTRTTEPRAPGIRPEQRLNAGPLRSVLHAKPLVSDLRAWPARALVSHCMRCVGRARDVDPSDGEEEEGEQESGAFGSLGRFTSTTQSPSSDLDLMASSGGGPAGQQRRAQFKASDGRCVGPAAANKKTAALPEGWALSGVPL